MLPSFDNIVRLTDHGDASFYGNPWTVGHLTNGMLVIRDFYNPGGRFISVPEDTVPATLSLFAL